MNELDEELGYWEYFPLPKQLKLTLKRLQLKPSADGEENSAEFTPGNLTMPFIC